MPFMKESTDHDSGSPLLASSLLSSRDAIVLRPASDNNKMRKYQQLTLAILAIVSLVAFMYYKHEYERLRYTLEYLDTFGAPPPGALPQQQPCGYASHPRVTTPPADWTRVASDIVIYSSFWDGVEGITGPKLRTIAIVGRSKGTPTELKVQLWYETGDKLFASCVMEEAEPRKHVLVSHKDFRVAFLLCSAIIPQTSSHLHGVAPYMVQFKSENEQWTDFRLIQETEGLKTIVDRSTLCVMPNIEPTTTINLVEFISFYHIIGFQKFVFYGNGLTPLMRNLLDRYIDEIGIMVEEKSFNSIPGMDLLVNNTNSPASKNIMNMIRQVIELDCQYRNRETSENIVVLHTNEFIVTNERESLATVLRDLAVVGGRSTAVAEFHLSSQRACIDKQHPVGGMMRLGADVLRLGQQARSLGRLQEEGVAVLRPMMAVGFGWERRKEQHVAAASAVVMTYQTCDDQDKHADVAHLPTRINFVERIQKSLLYRKWTVNRS